MATDVKNPEHAPDRSGEEKTAGHHPLSAQLRGETIAYAAQSIVYNLGGNIFEPYINYRIQKRFSGPDAEHPGKYGNYLQNLAGEFAGDITGAGTLILAEMLVPHQLHFCTRKMRSWVDPLYTSVAHRVFAHEQNEPDYAKKIEEWKTFQERNLARSVIIATGSIAGNLATQKWLVNNPSPTKLIFAGKLASTALTTALGLTVRLAFPKQMKGVDSWMSTHFFAPLLKEPAANETGFSRQT